MKAAGEWSAAWFRVGTGTYLGIVLATLVWVLGVERQAPLVTLGNMAVLAGPGFLIFGVALVRWIDRQEPLTWARRLEAALRGMLAGVAILVILFLLAAPFIGAYVLWLAIKFFVPLLAGGLAMGLGCQVGTRGQRR